MPGWSGTRQVAPTFLIQHLTAPWNESRSAIPQRTFRITRTTVPTSTASVIPALPMRLWLRATEKFPRKAQGSPGGNGLWLLGEGRHPRQNGDHPIDV